MKKGDKVYCIKEFGDIFFVDKEYKICNIVGDVIYVSFTYQHQCYFYLPSSFRSMDRIFSDHFITVKEYRMLKLDKIRQNVSIR